MVLVGCFVLPHGGIAMDPSYFTSLDPDPSKNEEGVLNAWRLHNASIVCGKTVEELRPDVIFMTSPHAMSDFENFLFYGSNKAAGYADTTAFPDGCDLPATKYHVNINLAPELAGDIVSQLKLASPAVKVSALTGFARIKPLQLHWGEVIPLAFIPQSFLDGIEVLLMTFPFKRLLKTEGSPTQTKQNSPGTIEELQHLGKELYHYFESMEKRVVVVISGDLAHRHDPNNSNGFSKASQPFDEACGLWTKTLDGDYLLKTATNLVDEAGVCGYMGMVLLDAVLSASGKSEWHSKLMALSNPTYYGMMVSAFLRKTFLTNTLACLQYGDEQFSSTRSMFHVFPSAYGSYI